jgi:hypothetical protein
MDQNEIDNETLTFPHIDDTFPIGIPGAEYIDVNPGNRILSDFVFWTVAGVIRAETNDNGLGVFSRGAAFALQNTLPAE